MKVMFLFQGVSDTPNYYAHLLEKLQGLGDVSLVVLVAWEQSGGPSRLVSLPAGQFSYRILDVRDRDMVDGHRRVPDLWKHILRERPDVIVTVPEYLKSFRTRPSVRLARLLTGSRLILKSIPFRVPTRDALREDLRRRYAAALGNARGLAWRLDALAVSRRGVVSRLAGVMLRPLQVLRRQFALLRTRRIENALATHWCYPDAHVNYLDDARDVYGSYGVPCKRIFVIRNSPDTDTLLAVRCELVREGMVKHPRRCIHIGRLVEWKRVDLLLEAFAQVKRAFADAELVIAGDGPKRQVLEAQATSLGLGDSVRFVGGVYETHALGRLLLESGVYVLAGMGGLSINDAMCFGLPVICSVCDGTERVLVRPGENGWFFADGDRDSLAEKIAGLFADPARMAHMGLRSTEIIRDDVNVWTVIGKYLEAFEFVTGQRLDRARANLAARRDESSAKWNGLLRDAALAASIVENAA